MTRSLYAALAGIAALSAPAMAQAQDATATVLINATVDKACVLGNPDVALLPLGDLTGPNGAVDAALTGSSVVASATIDLAWCNAPSTLSINASPLTLQSPPPYATPSGFSRQVTYDATLVGWPSDLNDRPLEGDAAKTLVASQAHSAPGPGLVLNISNLESLSPGGTVETPNLVLEAGLYSASVIISLSAN